MVVHVCCKRLSPIFHLFFQTMLQVCLSGGYICCTYMLQVFHTNVVKVDRDVAYVAMVVHIYCKLLFPMFHQSYVANVFIRMLHIFHTYVSYICCVRFIWMLCSLQWFQMFFWCFIVTPLVLRTCLTPRLRPQINQAERVFEL